MDALPRLRHICSVRLVGIAHAAETNKMLSPNVHIPKTDFYMLGGLADAEEKAASLAATKLISLVDFVTLSPSLLVKSSLLQKVKMKLRQFLFRHDVV